MAGYDLKKPEEVKEYLKNLHTEYKFGCYSEKNAEVCHLLGDFTESVKKDFPKAALLYKMACDDYNYPRSCAKFGDYSLIGKGCKKDIQEAYKYLCKACDLNNEKGCHHAGVVALSNEDLKEKDRGAQIAKGIAMLTKSCAANYEKSCFHLAGVYISGIDGYVDKNLKEAYKLSLKCCEIGNPYACANVSQMHTRGDGVQKNTELADTFKKRAIALHNEIRNYKKQLKFHAGIDP